MNEGNAPPEHRDSLARQVGTSATSDERTYQPKIMRKRDTALNFLQLQRDVAAILLSASDVLTLLQQVAHLVVPAIVDGCMVHLVDSDGTLHQAVAVHQNPVRQEQLRTLASVGVADVRPTLEPHYVAYLGRSQIVYDVRELLEGVAAPEQAYPGLLNQIGVKSCVVVPLIARHQTLAVMTFLTDRTGWRVTHAVEMLLEDLAQRVALAIDNIHLATAAQEDQHHRECFLSIATHELNSLITSMLGFGYILEQRWTTTMPLREQEQEVFNMLERQAMRMKQLIAALFNALRVDPSRIILDLRPVELQSVARALAVEAQTSSDLVTVQFTGTDELLMVHGDIVYLTQMITNLIQNAIKYSPFGSTITIQVERREHRAALIVSDQGRGIPTSAMPHIFERYYRADNVGGIAGYGVGLYIVHEVVERHGGSIEVQSVVGQGTLFTILLPLME